MKEIKTYSDNLPEEEFEGLLLTLKRRKQTLEYFDACAKRMGRYAKKNKPLYDWPTHIRWKYQFVVNMHEEARRGVVLAT